MSYQPVTSVPLASQPRVKIILTRSVKSKVKYRQNDVPVAGVPSQLHIKYVGRRVGKALGDAVGLRMMFGGKGRNTFFCIVDATSCCRCTSLYRLLKRSLYRLTTAVDGGGRTQKRLAAKRTSCNSCTDGDCDGDALKVLGTYPQGH